MGDSGWRRGKGEAIEDAARREVIEETGCIVKDLKFLYSQTPSNGITDQVMHVFGARVESKQSVEVVYE